MPKSLFSGPTFLHGLFSWCPPGLSAMTGYTADIMLKTAAIIWCQQETSYQSSTPFMMGTDWESHIRRTTARTYHGAATRPIYLSKCNIYGCTVPSDMRISQVRGFRTYGFLSLMGDEPETCTLLVQLSVYLEVWNAWPQRH